MHDATPINGEYYPSVTEILSSKPKPWLDRWRQKWGVRADRKTKAATDIGSALHKAIESQMPPLTSRTLAMYTVFFNWAAEQKLSLKQTELRVKSHYYKYQGTFDAIGYLGKSKTLFIFDWKTSSAIYPEMGLQLTAYARAYEEMTGTKINTGIIVHISKDKPKHKLTVKRFKLTDGRFEEFIAMLNSYRETDEFKKRSAQAKGIGTIGDPLATALKKAGD
jgi:hypothetical protein